MYLWKESLSFDKTVKSELASAYADKKKSIQILNLVGIALIAIGFLLCPMIVTTEMYILDNIVFACGMLLAGAGVCLEHWEMKALPKAAELVGTFQFSQEKTIKFGESATDGKLYSVCEILCYEDIPYVTLEITGVKISFKVSDMAAEYLANYFL